MTIGCDHPRPKLNLPGYTPPRYSWQPPTFLPSGSLADLSRALTDQFRGVYAVLQQLGQRRTVVPLIEDLEARAGQVIVGVANGQTIRLPLGLDGELGQVGIVLTDVIDPVTIVNPDGSPQTLGTAGAYDFVGGLTDSYQTNPGGTVLGGGIATDRLLGRDTAGTGAFESISVTGGLEFSGSQSIRIADLGVTTGKINDLAVTTGKINDLAVTTGKIADDGVTDAKLRNSTALSVIGRAGSSSGDPADIAATGRRQFLGTNASGTSVSFQSLSLLFPGATIYDVMAAPFNATGNGVADDTSAINAAIAAANSVPGVIYLGPNHRITSALTTVTGNNIIIQGRGRFDGGSIISIDAASDADFLQFEGQYSGIQDTWFRGIGAVYTTGATVRFYGAFQGSARRLSFSDVANGIEVVASTLTKISEITITDIYGSYGIHVHGEDPFYSHATWIDNSLFSTNFGASVVGSASNWQASTSYSAGNVVVANGFIYQASTGGTSAGSGTGPSGIPGSTVSTAHTATITDGTVQWVLAMPETTWIIHDAFADTVRILDCAFLQGGYAIRMIDTSGGTDFPQFLRVVNAEIDHCLTGGVVLSGGRQAEFEQLFVTSMMNGHSIEIESTFGGVWRFSGGVVFASGVETVVISAGDGVMSDMFIGGGGLLTANTYDAVRVDASVEHFNIENCCIGRFPGTTTPQTRYGISIAAGCDNYSIQGNRLLGHDTAPVLNTPGTAATRIVRNNIPDASVSEIEETGAGPFNDYDPAGARHIMCSNAAGVFTGVVSTGIVGDTLIFSHQGTGYTEFQHNTGSSAGNVFFTGRLGKSLRIFDNEIAIFRLVDTVSGASTVTRWELQSPLFPFAHASDDALGDVKVHDGTHYVTVAGGNNANVVLRGNATFGTVSNAALATMSSPRLKGRTTSGTGAVEDLTLTTTATITPNTSSGGAIGWDVPADAVTNSILANMAQSTVKGRAVGAGTGDPQDLTAAQVRAIVDSAPITEVEESGAGPFNDYDPAGARHIMASNAAGVFTGVSAAGFVVGDEITFSHQGSGYTEFQHNTGSAVGNVFFTGRQGRALRIYDNEIAVFRYVDTASGGSVVTRWELQSPLFPWAQSGADAAGDITMHNGTNYIAVQPYSTSILRNGTTIERAALTGDVTASQNSNATTIANNAVSDAKLRDSAALSVIGRSANSTGDPADIAAGSDGHVLRRSGTTLGFGTIATAGITDDAVTNAKLANMAEATIKGRASGAGTGDPTDLSASQVATILALNFTTVLAVHYSETADASISITPPAGATWFEIECQGGGGGGGGVDAEGTKESCAAAGGSSGAWLRHRLAITTGNITGAIGSGGSGGSNTGGNGGNGTSTSFTYDGTTLTASGGNGGAGNTTGVDLNPGFRGRLGTSAGAATIGAHETSDGQRGQPGIEFSASAADANGAIGGHGGDSRCGCGGSGSIANGDGVTGGSGETGHGPGAGGGGAARTSTGAASTGATGGSGRDGSMRVVFYSGPVPTFSSIS